MNLVNLCQGLCATLKTVDQLIENAEATIIQWKDDIEQWLGTQAAEDNPQGARAQQPAPNHQQQGMKILIIKLNGMFEGHSKYD